MKIGFIHLNIIYKMQPEDKIEERLTNGNSLRVDWVFCSDCKEPLKAIWENNGFEPPDPTHWEITGYENCSICFFKSEEG